MKIWILNGPNLDQLHRRETKYYGKLHLRTLARWLQEAYPQVLFTFFQSNYEGALVEKIHEALDQAEALIINAGALSHYSYALRDALALCPFPKIEVHLSNIYARESFRHHSVLSAVCEGTITGFKEYSYWLAVRYLIEKKA